MIIIKWYIIAVCIMSIFVEFRALKHEEINVSSFIIAIFMFIPILVYVTAN